MSQFQLDNQLKADCFHLGSFSFSHLLLLNNAEIPWFILVPETSQTELYKLQPDEQIKLLDEINQMSAFLEQHYDVEKLNIGAIGNIVKQMHIHVIARHSNDYCWPGVTWGKSARKTYTNEQVNQLKKRLSKHFHHTLTVAK